MFALSLTIYEIIANQIKCTKFDLENKGQGQGVEKLGLRHSIGNGRFLGNFLYEFYLKTYIYANYYTGRQVKMIHR